ncbi:unnamed protein product [Pleuronectes platessa]|uniref:Uncharacterized protein n=1 Tax=Pleuronectes platessa TaxID=8262 RepID=A0A9N7UEH2_PLEPL|nr:unnamed protein product [Pleuronectes platessa]
MRMTHPRRSDIVCARRKDTSSPRCGSSITSTAAPRAPLSAQSTHREAACTESSPNQQTCRPLWKPSALLHPTARNTSPPS